MINIGLIGFGYWGPNLARNLSQISGAKLVAICEADPQKAAKAKSIYPAVEIFNNIDLLLNNPDVTAVIIATPVYSHYGLAKKALLAGKDVLIEKPMTTTVTEAEDLLKIARETHRIISVDHTFVFTPAVQKIKELVKSGDLGDLLYFDSVRINLGLFQSDINVIYDLAPHDLSILNFIKGANPVALRAFGIKHAGTDLEDQAYIHLEYNDNFVAHFHVSWLAPVKIRRTLIAGTKKMIVYDDMEPSEKIKIYDKSIIVKNQTCDETVHKIKIDYRTGDMLSPKLEQMEALKGVVTDFVNCVQTRTRPVIDGSDGLKIVKILEATKESIKQNGQRINL